MINTVASRNEYVGGIFYRSDSRLEEVPSDIPQEAIEVHLQDNKITLLRTGTFSHLTQCTKLDIHNNSIAIIEEDAFTVMVLIHTLNLYRNKLTALEKSNGLTSLTYLEIQINLIETIPDG